jgi:type 1 glutamine amidotransferase
MQKIKTLVFAGGEIHNAKGCGKAIVDALSTSEEFEITYVEEVLDTLTAPKLAPYDVIVFYYTYGKVTDAQKNGLLNFVASGKGFVGIHSTSSFFMDSPECLAMLGGTFLTHPPYREYQVSVVDPEHPITKGLNEFLVTDEQYILDFDPRVNVLCSALWKGTAMPVAWTKSWGKGRVFYLALGHDEKACNQEIFRLLLARGTKWAGTTGEA